ncbi:hypothetical protein NXX54_00220 [Bacteroides sp. BFG-638]|uniref:hypothetical protein n=1 Tax=Bacteroides sp. BFG-638 TaxID=2972765 RepID=UPI002165375C|nr:hypothetical protein [Bacteroides sp. BFG-638]MCS2946888.1 hypothetical protein [Bacteroides sp. BFG-638]
MDRFKKYDTFFLVIFCLLISQSIRAEIKLPGYFTDNMMLQRDMPIKIWGWGNRYETVTVSIHDQKVNTRCKKDGTWGNNFISYTLWRSLFSNGPGKRKQY